MAILISIPIFTGLILIQSGILSRMPLLNGTVDIILLTMLAWSLQDNVKAEIEWAIVGSLIAGFATALPFGTLIIAYLLATGISLYLKRIIWKVPLLAMFVATFIGTILLHTISYIAVSIRGTILPIDQTFNQVILPSLLLNILASIPVYLLVTDLANWVYPEEL